MNKGHYPLQDDENFLLLRGFALFFAVVRELFALVMTVPSWLYANTVLGLVVSPKDWGLGVEALVVLGLANFIPVLLSHITAVFVLGIGGVLVMGAAGYAEKVSRKVAHKVI